MLLIHAVVGAESLEATGRRRGWRPLVCVYENGRPRPERGRHDRSRAGARHSHSPTQTSTALPLVGPDGANYPVTVSGECVGSGRRPACDSLSPGGRSLFGRPRHRPRSRRSSLRSAAGCHTFNTALPLLRSRLATPVAHSNTAAPSARCPAEAIPTLRSKCPRTARRR
jgi:hypothetical protein